MTTWAFVLVLIAAGRLKGGEPAAAETPQHGLLNRLRPAGGWHPYGGGLTHWWNPHCFPCQTVPDDYCRKPLPRVCWPPYAPYYRFGSADDQQDNGYYNCNKPH